MNRFIVCLLLLLFASTAFAADTATFTWADHPGKGELDLTYAGKPVLRYMYAFDTSTPERTAETFKVYHHVFGPGTDKLITKGPGGLYTHHRGLFVGWMTTAFEGKRLDFWHCKNGAHLKHVRFLNQQADGNSATTTAEIHWNDGEGKPVIVEQRTLHVTNIGASPEAPAWQIDWSTQLESSRGPIDLSGDRQHAGFQFRAAQSVADTNSAAYTRPAGFPQEPKAFEVDDRGDPPRHINLNWLAMSYPIDGKKFTVVYLEDPSLPKPSLYSERPYGRFGAFFKTTIKPDKPLAMHYRIQVLPGDAPKPSQLEAAYEQFVSDLTKRSK